MTYTRDKNETLKRDPRLWNKMCYWNGGVPKDFLGGEILRGSKGVEQEQNRPLLWSVKGTSFLIQMCLVLGILKDEFEVWKTWIFIIGLNWVGVFETQLIYFFSFLIKKNFISMP